MARTITLPPEVLAVAAIASTDAHRPNLGYVHANPAGYVEATNGVALVRRTFVRQDDAGTDELCMIDAKAAAAIAKGLRKCPVAVVTVEDDGHVVGRFASETVHAQQVAAYQDPAHYPATQQVIDSANQAISLRSVRVSLDPAQLLAIAKALTDSSARNMAVTLTIPVDESRETQSDPIRVEGSAPGFGLLMPCRL